MKTSPSKKERRFETRMSVEDLQLLDRQATEAGMNRSEFIRHLLINSTVRPRGELYVYLREINRIGVNLNQIARAVNRHREPLEVFDLLYVLTYMEMELSDLVKMAKMDVA